MKFMEPHLIDYLIVMAGSRGKLFVGIITIYLIPLHPEIKEFPESYFTLGLLCHQRYKNIN